MEELYERDLAVPVDVEYADDPFHERVLGQLGHVEELFRLQLATLVGVQFLEAFVEFLDLLLGD